MTDPRARAGPPPADPAGAKGGQTRARIKSAALRLFAAKGLDNVSIREILAAAGQRNAGSINYHFSSRAALVAELIGDAAKLLDARHLERIEALERAGGPRTMREVADILVDFSLPEGDAAEDASHAARFMNRALIDHREMVYEALQDGQDQGARRCLAHLRRMAPDLPGPLMQQRLALVMVYLIAAASARQAARGNEASWRGRWGRESFRRNLADTVVGMLVQPCAPETLAALAEEEAQRPDPAPPPARR